jgi:hypothetical protein
VSITGELRPIEQAAGKKIFPGAGFTFEFAIGVKLVLTKDGVNEVVPYMFLL